VGDGRGLARTAARGSFSQRRQLIRMCSSTGSSGDEMPLKRPKRESGPSSALQSGDELDDDLEDAYQSSGGSGGDHGGDYMASDDEDFAPKKKAAPKKAKLKLSGASKALYSTDTGPSRLKVVPSGSRPARPKAAPLNANQLVSDVFAEERDFSFLPLKVDHATRPYYISPSSGNIILEAFHPLAAQATDFLIAIAEPVSRPTHIHEYKLTAHSLYAAVSVGLKTEDIIEVLNRMSKVPVPDEIQDFIRDCTVSYGKVKLVLKKNKHYIESGHAETLRILLRDEIVAKARVVPVEGEGDTTGGKGETATYGLEKDKAPKRAGLVIPGTKAAGAPVVEEPGADKEKEKAAVEDDLFTSVVGLEKGQSPLLSQQGMH
jgi:DNA excision repair protein ERCC-3